jgi:hypothetical protein
MINGRRLFGAVLSIFVSSTMWTSPVRALEFTLTNVSIDGGGNAVGLLPGATYQVDVDYVVWNSSGGCPGCIMQLVIGTDDGSQDCVYDGIPGIEPGVSGHGHIVLTAPNAPGTYDLAAESFWTYNCASAIYGFGQGANRTVIGSITVAIPTATEAITFSRLKLMFRD